MLPACLIVERGLVREFQFNEPVVTRNLSASPVVIASAVVLVNSPTDRVWLNASVDWFFSFTGGGSANVLFEITRDDTVIHSAMQSISGAALVFGFVVYNHVNLQYVDLYPASAAGLTPVLYKLQARVVSAPSGTAAVTSAVLSAAELALNPVR
ncbi:MAG: hypothetical protein IMW97_05170 [Firmicutes bacterium]|nr:hypothetical protein [Candidatus Fermentithermobacillaceae bacterium]